MPDKKNIKSLPLNNLKSYLKENNFPQFRGKQLFNWIYKHGVNDFEQMNNLPQDLIDFLKSNFYLSELNLIKKQIAKDNTIKYLWELNDENTIESVYLPTFDENRHSVCISSQVGCAQGCKFCATGINGFIRNLTTSEIVDQVLKIQKDISNNNFKMPAITNIVYMGMGEPFTNLENVLKSLYIFNDNKGLNIGMRKITISTAGIVPKIKEFAQKKLQTGLAVSLNAPTNKLRNKLMPINKKYPLKELITAIEQYINITGRIITFEYILIKNTNDSFQNAHELIDLLKDINCHINLIPANPVTELNIDRPAKRRIKKFKNILDEHNLSVTIRKERGANIKAACGQLQRIYC